MAIKLIFTDLDGTLILPNTDILSPRTEAAMQAAHAQGVILVPCTGRSLDWVPEWVFEHPCIRYVCTSGGARITDIRTGDTVSLSTLPRNTLFQVLEAIMPYATQGGVFTCGMSVNENRQGPPGARHQDVPGHIKTDVVTFFRHRPQFAAEKVDFYFDDMDELQECLKALQAIPGITLGSAFDTNIEITTSEGDKGGAIRRLAALLGVDIADTMCMGDGLNDLSMFPVAGLAVAMENATPRLKEVAHVITASCDEDGAAQAIEKYVLGCEQR